jgi:GntR family transcriptional repressor for pyruvate dehydrogenase complex
MLPLDTSATPAFDKVARAPRLSDKVADLMLKAIVSRRLRPGERLPSERELGEQFGVSRTVVREAVKSLTAKGVIEVRSGSGLRVAAVNGAAVTESLALYLHGSTVDYSKVHEIRTGLEVQMAAAAAARRTDEDLRLLVRACEHVEATIHDSDLAAMHDVEFHRAIGGATHNELYVVLLDAVGGAMLEVRRANLGHPQADSLTLAHHRAILEAIRAGSAAAAADAMRLHLEDVARLRSSVAVEGGDAAAS